MRLGIFLSGIKGTTFSRKRSKSSKSNLNLIHYRSRFSLAIYSTTIFHATRGTSENLPGNIGTHITGGGQLSQFIHGWFSPGNLDRVYLKHQSSISFILNKIRQTYRHELTQNLFPFISYDKETY